jgi:hypothetical protein
MEEKPESEKQSGLTIKFVGKGGPAQFRTKNDHLQIAPPYQRLVCYHCGFWISPYPDSSTGTVPIRIFSCISKCFAAEHRRCKPRPEGRDTFIWLCREWDDFMEKYSSQREGWEKDHETKWARTDDWGKKYDEWISLPYKRRGK